MGIIESYMEYIREQKRYSLRTQQLYKSAIEEYYLYIYSDVIGRRRRYILFIPTNCWRPSPSRM
jgi:hypothetical protein